MLVILTAMTNFVLILLAPGAHDLTELNRQTAEFNGTEVGVGWFLFWPGLLVVWGAAWVGFVIAAVKRNFRTGLAVFLLTETAWFLPWILFLVTLL